MTKPDGYKIQEPNKQRQRTRDCDGLMRQSQSAAETRQVGSHPGVQSMALSLSNRLMKLRANGIFSGLLNIKDTYLLEIENYGVSTSNND